MDAKAFDAAILALPWSSYVMVGVLAVCGMLNPRIGFSVFGGWVIMYGLIKAL